MNQRRKEQVEDGASCFSHNSEQHVENEEEDFKVETEEEDISQGDYVKVVKEQFVGYFAWK